MTKVSEAEKQQLKRNEEKWTLLLMEAGWTVIPTVILERQQALGLDSLDLNIILQLAKYWWFAENQPHPSKKTIANAIGVSESTVRKRIKRLEQDGLIQRVKRFHPSHGGQTSNEYSFEGLIKEATPYAKEALQERKKRRQEDQDKLTRKKPRLKRVK